MSFDQSAQHSVPETYSMAEFHYFVCDAIPATEEMKSRPRYGRPGGMPPVSDSANDLGDAATNPLRTNDEKNGSQD